MTLLLSYHSFLHDMSILFLMILLVGNVLAGPTRVTTRPRNILLVCCGLLFLSPLMLVLTSVRRLWLINLVLILLFAAIYRTLSTVRSVEA